MSLPWFKFYATDFLTDPKLILLSPVDKYLFVILLCLANTSDEGGFIPNLTALSLLTIARVPISEETQNILTRLQDYGLITVDNGGVTVCRFMDRQNRGMTPYERVKKYRDKKRMLEKIGTNDNEMLSLKRDDNGDDNPLDETRRDETRKNNNTTVEKKNFKKQL